MSEKQVINPFTKWLKEKRESGVEDWFTVYEVCKEVKTTPSSTVYRKFNRMVAYSVLEMKYNGEKHAMLYRWKK